MIGERDFWESIFWIMVVFGAVLGLEHGLECDLGPVRGSEGEPLVSEKTGLGVWVWGALLGLGPVLG